MSPKFILTNTNINSFNTEEVINLNNYLSSRGIININISIEYCCRLINDNYNKRQFGKFEIRNNSRSRPQFEHYMILNEMIYTTKYIYLDDEKNIFVKTSLFDDSSNFQRLINIFFLQNYLVVCFHEFFNKSKA